MCKLRWKSFKNSIHFIAQRFFGQKSWKLTEYHWNFNSHENSFFLHIFSSQLVIMRIFPIGHSNNVSLCHVCMVLSSFVSFFLCTMYNLNTCCLITTFWIIFCNSNDWLNKFCIICNFVHCDSLFYIPSFYKTCLVSFSPSQTCFWFFPHRSLAYC